MAHGMHGKHGILFISHRFHKFHSFILPQTSFYPTDCYLAAFVFLDMKTREHDLLSRRLFSPTNYTNFTPLFSLKRLFLPQMTQITRILFFFFLDMKTREHVFFSRRLLFLTECTECTEFYLSPTDDTDFFATLKILFCLGIKLLITKFAL